MAFSGPEFLARHDPWYFVDTRGRRHVARELGYRDGARWLNRFEEVAGKPAEQEAIISRFVRVLFPVQARYWFRRPWLMAGWVGVVGAVILWRRGVTLPHWLDGALLLLALCVSVGLLITQAGDPDPWIEFQRLPGPAQVEAIRDVFRRAVGPNQAPPTPSVTSTLT